LKQSDRQINRHCNIWKDARHVTWRYDENVEWTRERAMQTDEQTDRQDGMEQSRTC